MIRGTVTPRRVLLVALFLSSPTAIMLVVLAGAGRLDIWPAIGTWVMVTSLLLPLVRSHLGELSGLANWVRTLAHGGDIATAPGKDGMALAEIAAAVAALRRLWQHRSAELAETARWNASLLENLPDPLLLLDSGRRVVRANRAATRLFGRDPAGSDLAAVLRDPTVTEAVQAVVSGAAPFRECEFTQAIPVERFFAARIERLDGQPAFEAAIALLTLHELTAIRRMERMRADFVANASHELRTPLAALSGFIETLQGPARDDEEAREKFLGIMAEQSGRMSRLVADLLSLSRIELDEHSQPGETVDLARLATSAAEALRPLASPRGMELVVEIADGLPPVTGQSDQLAQLLQNLMENAVKYGNDGSAVEVSVALADSAPSGAGTALRAGPVVRLAVKDHGEGIPAEHIPRLTERFYRVDTARSRKMGGTGLGLAIVKHIVNRHRGLLTIDSRMGEGSTFTVWLPAAPVRDRPAATSAP
ncbi:Phosphate regulon sensor protein PhoR (SphS) [Paramagnetospirillum magnetotacticum MS-1]|uniref:histidine kinase n=1 Tax=Paramagnetospirillum magnetotacticum MS-1 TaxID=272627 RepID=A0A0C2YEQ4_PARME|nr:ATP-binding protein [Paramagnetospirillum magnetotacticum]KIL98184.1 Phosphate regulon sensor protein PhoR (SphS) [Paramagnetospirillum magnetotacticum MS-1]